LLPPARTLGDAERNQHTLTVLYQRIRQPEIWAQWVRNQVDAFGEGRILSSQIFMNAAAIKYNKICVESDGQDFPGSATTLQEDIVAMMAATKRKFLPGAPPEKGKPTSSTTANDDRKKFKQPPFVKHYKSSVADGDKAFKVGDTKVWNKETWHFCDCPNHRDRIKWHTHSTADCRTHRNWIEKGSPPVISNPAINDSNADDEEAPFEEEDSLLTDDITTLLANTLSLAGDHTVASELIANAMDAIHNT
jgi:hypothetical protein